ncbi:hemin-degrading factor [Chitinimonas sp. BJB300]|uniref:hemin-degrading factor n=1 Tax=Chitinimonas sp. BJB300 TaxID=1559339 RepID=UPI000C0F7F08|nr:ChuX/HutX family heme-like substrate-binding protein [Chitinimonas sp. BJB300]PHV12413.1 hemin-degrading factor [Chitinimonas sp. BJB300]TSJ89011.1 hemin-degrading factor [Chitinimonas sp. BJB300]
MNASTLWQSYLHLKAGEPKIRARDAAARLGVSEAELVAADPQSITLFPKWADILGELEKLGSVMTLTRNEAAVHEKTGVYANVRIQGEMGLALNPEIDLRFFLHSWRYGFAVKGERFSIQFFDRHGDAVHKIFLTPQSDTAAYDELLTHYASSHAHVEVDSPRERQDEQPDAAIDQTAFRQGWLNLQDTHDFFPLLRKYSASRPQALRLAPHGFVREVELDSVELLLTQAARTQLSIMVFAGNQGCLQIHTGPVQKIVSIGPWLNVLDPGFNLHLRTDLFAKAFVVRKPTRDGEVTSLECYDAAGELIVQFFGERKPGKPELAAWTALAYSLPDREMAHAA